MCGESDSRTELMDGLDKPASIKKSIQAVIMSSQNCDKPLPQGNSCKKKHKKNLSYVSICLFLVLKNIFVIEISGICLLERTWQGQWEN